MNYWSKKLLRGTEKESTKRWLEILIENPSLQIKIQVTRYRWKWTFKSTLDSPWYFIILITTYSISVSSVQFSHSVTSDSLWPHEPQQVILCHPLLLLPSIFPSIRVLGWMSNESLLHIGGPKYGRFSFRLASYPPQNNRFLMGCSHHGWFFPRGILRNEGISILLSYQKYICAFFPEHITKI